MAEISTSQYAFHLDSFIQHHHLLSYTHLYLISPFPFLLHLLPFYLYTFDASNDSKPDITIIYFFIVIHSLYSSHTRPQPHPYTNHMMLSISLA